VPSIKRIGWEAVAHLAEEGEADRSGIKGAIDKGAKGKGKGKGRGRAGDEWDLDTDGEGTKLLEGREDLPVLVTLNLVRWPCTPDGLPFFSVIRVGCQAE
jgi:exosome complex component RRP42